MSTSTKTNLWALILSALVAVCGVAFSSGQTREAISNNTRRIEKVEHNHEAHSQLLLDIRFAVYGLSNDVSRLVKSSEKIQ